MFSVFTLHLSATVHPRGLKTKEKKINKRKSISNNQPRESIIKIKVQQLNSKHKMPNKIGTAPLVYDKTTNRITHKIVNKKIFKKSVKRTQSSV